MLQPDQLAMLDRCALSAGALQPSTPKSWMGGRVTQPTQQDVGEAQCRRHAVRGLAAQWADGGAYLSAAHDPQATGAVPLRVTRHRLLPAAPAVAIRHLMAVQQVLRGVVLQLDGAAAGHLRSCRQRIHRLQARSVPFRPSCQGFV